MWLLVVERVIPCATQPVARWLNGAHGVTRLTTWRDLFVAVRAPDVNGSVPALAGRCSFEYDARRAGGGLVWD